MQCRRCGGYRSVQVEKHWWQALVPCASRFQCTICGRETLRLSVPAEFRGLGRQFSDLIDLARLPR